MLRLTVFGGLSVSSEGQSVDRAALRRRPLALLAVIATAGELGIARDKLLALFWPESDTESARTVLRQTIYALRRDLRAAELFLGNTDLRINPKVLTSDVAEFEQSVAAADFDRAVSTYGGSFLDGVHVGEAPEFDYWLERERARFDREFRRSVEMLAQRAVERGDAAAEARCWERLATIDPLDSRVAIAFMRALAKSGDISGALRHAQLYEKLVRAELDTLPDPQVIALATEIRETERSLPADGAGASSHAASVPHTEQQNAGRISLGQLRSTRLVGWRGRAGAAVAILIAVLTAISLRAFYTNSRTIPSDPHALAVLPFDVNAADSSLAFLRAGIPDLIAAAVRGTPAFTVVDERAVRSALRENGGDPRGDIQRDVAMRVGRRVGASHVVFGSVVGSPRWLVINVRIAAPSNDSAGSPVQVAGPLDSLAKLADRVVVRILARAAASDEVAVSDLAGRPLPALRAYLDGRAAYREDRLEDAVERFRTALHLDSSFALAALGIAEAGGWTESSLSARDAKDFSLGWALRSRLSVRDQALFDGFIGARDPSQLTDAASLAAWEHAFRLLPRRAEVAYEYGDRLYHVGDYLGVSDAEQQAAREFSYAVSRDSNLFQPLRHLVEIMARHGDAAGARRLLGIYLQRDSAADAAGFLRWQIAVSTGDSVALRAVRRQISQMPVASLRRVAGLSQLDAVDVADADRAVAALLKRDLPPSDRAMVLYDAHALALNRGDLVASEEFLKELAAVHGDDGSRAVWYGDARQLRVLDALFSIGDTVAGKFAANAIAADRSDTRTGRYPWTRSADLCTLELWRASHGDSRHTSEALALLRASERDSSRYYGWNAGICIDMVEALSSVVRRRSDADTHLGRLDSLMAAGPYQFGMTVGNLMAAKLFASRGDWPRALRAARRRRRDWNDGPWYRADALALEAQALKALGDTAGFRVAVERYAALRGAPAVRLSALELAAIRRP